MATPAPGLGLPLPFKPHIPITPPPDCVNFSSQPSQFSPREKQPSSGLAMSSAGAPGTTPHAPTNTAKEVKAEEGCQCHKGDSNSSKQAPMPTPTPTLHMPTPPGAASLDPRYVAMVSRIAAYYQQRCQAISNYQHQKCQAWANMQRQKCQDMTQAALLVVAWYVRDRIQRRRRRQKHQFRRALSERAGVGKAKKGESISKWASRLPHNLPPPDSAAEDRPVDTEELNFSMDAEPAPNPDAKLYDVADNMIKSQLARIDVPLMGALSFSSDEESESESESESEYEELHRWRANPEAPAREEEDGEDDGAENDDDNEDDEYSYDDEDAEDCTGGDDGSQRVHHGTGNNTRNEGSSVPFEQVNPGQQAQQF